LTSPKEMFPFHIDRAAIAARSSLNAPVGFVISALKTLQMKNKSIVHVI
jgi:hypothetical protein